MKKTFLTVLLWVPRILSILFVLFTLLFTFDAFDGTDSIAKKILGWLIHLVPSVVIAIVAWLSWKRPWIGGIVFTALAAAYYFTYGARSGNHIIDGALLGLGILFLASWLFKEKSSFK